MRGKLKEPKNEDTMTMTNIDKVHRLPLASLLECASTKTNIDRTKMRENNTPTFGLSS